ncbi:MAG TPA: metallophosphoesterase family protein [Caulobacteraceae bacterium]
MTPDRFADVRTIAVIADCHIHPDAGIDWPEGIAEALGGADLIVTLGDMGEARGLEALAAVAPLIGVRGEDDGEDPRTAPAARVLEIAGLRIGCVFDPMAAGLATHKEPLVAVDDGGAAQARRFGGGVAVVLYASTHDPEICAFEGALWINPGSLTLPNGKDRGVRGSFARLTIEAGAPKARIIRI